MLDTISPLLLSLSLCVSVSLSLPLSPSLLVSVSVSLSLSVSASVSLVSHQAAVSDYMQQSNRPYSYINVFDNLRKKIPKGECANKTTVGAPSLSFPSPIGMDDDTHTYIPNEYHRFDPHIGPFIDRMAGGTFYTGSQSCANPSINVGCSMHRLGYASLHGHPTVDWPPFRGTWVRIELLVEW